jgi:GT2 family glycosyltransferase
MANNEVCMKTVSVVIASHRPKGILAKCVRSLWEQSVTPLEVIIVVDTKEEEEQIEHLFYFTNLESFVYHTGKTGPTEARNLGISKSTGDIIAFIDDDAIAGEDWIKNMIRTFELVGCDIVGGPVSPMFSGGVIVDEKWWWIIGCTSDIPITTRPISCNMAVKKELFGKMGVFEEVGKRRMKHPMSEETEFCERALASGEIILWDPTINVYHNVPKERTTLSYMMNRAYREGVGKSVISETYNTDLEKHFLGYYLTHPDMYTIPVLASVAYGFARGKLLK